MVPVSARIGTETQHGNSPRLRISQKLRCVIQKMKLDQLSSARLADLGFSLEQSIEKKHHKIIIAILDIYIYYLPNALLLKCII